MKSLLQTERECYLTGRRDNLHRHHIYGGGRRALSEKYGLWVYLTGEMHNLSPAGVHFNRALDRQLKQAGQRAFENAYSREAFLRLFGKNYLENEGELRA